MNYFHCNHFTGIDIEESGPDDNDNGNWVVDHDIYDEDFDESEVAYLIYIMSS